jgi:hypothetical protein
MATAHIHEKERHNGTFWKLCAPGASLPFADRKTFNTAIAQVRKFYPAAAIKVFPLNGEPYEV